ADPAVDLADRAPAARGEGEGVVVGRVDRRAEVVVGAHAGHRQLDDPLAANAHVDVARRAARVVGLGRGEAEKVVPARQRPRVARAGRLADRRALVDHVGRDHGDVVVDRVRVELVDPLLVRREGGHAATSQPSRFTYARNADLLLPNSARSLASVSHACSGPSFGLASGCSRDGPSKPTPGWRAWDLSASSSASLASSSSRFFFSASSSLSSSALSLACASLSGTPSAQSLAAHASRPGKAARKALSSCLGSVVVTGSDMDDSCCWAARTVAAVDLSAPAGRNETSSRRDLR